MQYHCPRLVYREEYDSEPRETAKRLEEIEESRANQANPKWEDRYIHLNKEIEASNKFAEEYRASAK